MAAAAKEEAAAAAKEAKARRRDKFEQDAGLRTAAVDSLQQAVAQVGCRCALVAQLHRGARTAPRLTRARTAAGRHQVRGLPTPRPRLTAAVSARQGLRPGQGPRVPVAHLGRIAGRSRWRAMGDALMAAFRATRTNARADAPHPMRTQMRSRGRHLRVCPT